MALSIGDKLGPYEILAMIGKGGMGEVYRAHDSRLNRDVAIKVSNAQFTERFTREARTIAALNHTNICHLYDVGPNYLVMEYVEGNDLKGPLNFDDALPIIQQLIDGIEAAHEKNIVHRDLKPANIKITPEGVVKILDFGLAKAMELPPSGDGTPDNSPTLTMGMTEAGAILGTAAYMSPEQAKGKVADRRADIWSFAVVLYQLLTGRKLFSGETVVEVLGGVLNKEPNLSDAPPQVHRLLRWCLEKDRKKRLASISDARILLAEGPADEGVTSTASGSRGGSRFGMLERGVAVVATLVLAIVSFVHFNEKPPVPPELIKFEIFAPEKTAIQKFQVSPDGHKVAFFGDGVDGRGGLWVRSFDSTESKRVADADLDPPLFFWSADSRYLAFGSSGGANRLMRVDVTAGSPESVCDVPNLVIGGSWRSDGTIIFGGFPNGIWRAAASGCTPSQLTQLDPSRQDTGHFSPVFLPDEKHFLYLRQSNSPENTGIYLGSLDAKPDQQNSKRLIATNLSPVYAPSPNGGMGYVMFLRDAKLFAQSLDLTKLEVSGDPVQIASGLGSSYEFGYFSASTNGVLAYRTGSAGGNSPIQAAWLDRSGKSLGAAMELAVYDSIALSPDGARAALHRYDSGTVAGDIWLAEFGRHTFTRLTSDPADEYDPVWSPDGSHVAYASIRAGGTGLYQKASNGTGIEEMLLPPSNARDLNDWSRDGHFLMYSEVSSKGTKSDLWVLPMAPEKPSDAGKPAVYLNSGFNETQGQFSPDGHWVAYVSDETGKSEVYVQAFPLNAGGAGKFPVSSGGGVMPRWRRDGKELFFVANGRTVMSAEVAYTPSMKIGVPKSLFETAMQSVQPYFFGWDVVADGKRFLIPKATVAANGAQSPITVVMNWTALLKK